MWLKRANKIPIFFRSRKENLQLSSEYNKLQESYKQLEALKQKLETKEAVWRSNMTDSQKETDLAKQEVRRSPRGKQPIMGGRLRQSGVTKPTLKSVPSDPKLSSKVSVYIDVVGRFFRFVWTVLFLLLIFPFSFCCCYISACFCCNIFLILSFLLWSGTGKLKLKTVQMINLFKDPNILQY